MVNNDWVGPTKFSRGVPIRLLKLDFGQTGCPSDANSECQVQLYAFSSVIILDLLKLIQFI